jgi:hypothetical protein
VRDGFDQRVLSAVSDYWVSPNTARKEFVISKCELLKRWIIRVENLFEHPKCNESGAGIVFLFTCSWTIVKCHYFRCRKINWCKTVKYVYCSVASCTTSQQAVRSRSDTFILTICNTIEQCRCISGASILHYIEFRVCLQTHTTVLQWNVLLHSVPCNTQYELSNVTFFGIQRCTWQMQDFASIHAAPSTPCTLQLHECIVAIAADRFPPLLLRRLPDLCLSCWCFFLNLQWNISYRQHVSRLSLGYNISFRRWNQFQANSWNRRKLATFTFCQQRSVVAVLLTWLYRAYILWTWADISCRTSERQVRTPPCGLKSSWQKFVMF